jgi:hypothetical protein
MVYPYLGCEGFYLRGNFSFKGGGIGERFIIGKFRNGYNEQRGRKRKNE